MRRWAGAVIMLGALSHATSTGGVQLEQPIILHTVLEGSDAGPARAELGAELGVDVTSLFLYVDSVEAPGLVQIQLFPWSSPGTPLKVGAANVVSPGWVEFPLVGGPPTVESHRVVLESAEARVRFRHVPLHSIGVDLGETVRVRARLRGSSSLLAGVFRLAAGTDPLADPSCGVQGAVSGSPYVFLQTVSLSAGPQTQVTIAWMPNTPPGGVGLWWLGTGSDGGVGWTLGYEDGGTADLGVGDGLRYPPMHPALFPALVPFQEQVPTPPFRIIGRQGPGEWQLVSPGPGLDVCHPVVRASFGGARAQAQGWEPGADFVMWLYLDWAGPFCRDDDGDGHPGALGCGLWAGRTNVPPPGLVRALGVPDCDDRDPARHWMAGEQCNGLDDDCDGQVDELPFTTTPLCSRQVGPCEGARLAASLCVDGGWVAGCGAESYGSWYGQSEAACGSSDWNCDGVTSYAVPCRLQAGVCARSINLECTAFNPSACPPERYGPDYDFYELRCDGLDNDCDGEVDNVRPSPCPLQLGVCEGARRTVELCASGAWLACGPLQYGPHYEALEVTCDGLDNDCDGLTDGADPDLACERQLGVCAGARRSTGACELGVSEPCGAREYGARWQDAESRCDGLDNDCDGITDEDCPPSPQVPAARGPTHLSCSSFDSGALALAALSLLRRRRVSHLN